MLEIVKLKVRISFPTFKPSYEAIRLACRGQLGIKCDMAFAERSVCIAFRIVTGIQSEIIKPTSSTSLVLIKILESLNITSSREK